MPRPSVLRAALAGLAALGVVATGVSTPPPAAAAEEAEPLVVHLDEIDPTVPRRGDIRISGTVTNTSDDTFTRVNMHAFASQSPILDSLTNAAAIPASADVGPRVTVPGTFDTIDTLAPGETAPFTDSVPVDLLGIPDEAGVYWIGVHALGDGAVPRDLVADGRARTFIPVLPRGDGNLDASFVLPVRNRVWYDADGRIGGTERWLRRLSDGGTLSGVLDTADAAGTTPYTWLVDPAVLLAITRLSLGNPERSLAPDPTVPGQEPTEEPSPSESEEPAPVALDPAVPPGGQVDPEDAALAEAASAWLTRFRTLVGSGSVLALPFGDLDVSAAVRQAPERYTQALARSAEAMASLQVPADLAVAPAGGRLSPEAIAATPEDVQLILGDSAFAVPPSTTTSVVRLLGHEALLTSTGAESGGPGPTDPTDPLALRQRVLSEAALRIARDEQAPLVVTLPTTWREQDAESFFDGLEQPWLDTVPATWIAARRATGVNAANLAYETLDVEAELPAPGFAAADRADESAALLEQVLTLQTRLGQQVGDEVLVTLSEQHRQRPRGARAAAARVDDALRSDLGLITIEAPTRVTLSGDSGGLGATLVNGLDQPVSVGIGITTDGELTLTGDSVRDLGPRARSVVRFTATTGQAGIHLVRLRVTSVDGVPLGSADELPIRAARVSALIWIVMAAGALVLFGMIGYRLPGQIRARRAELRASEHRAAAEPDPEPAPGNPSDAAMGQV
ncbi:DUF6049 family protein [Nocardioides okcheonensis]|uniref:DUF6049 family protein n=1 Tax=Nocardioides okcheonensis TaxID=2894081 RepID=UPI001E610A6B|nr:DUF6049 family protein [Nocardioides okcheonensis]UFN42990.1 DUF6049 family protein [Nocardioides okcheonensis]